ALDDVVDVRIIPSCRAVSVKRNRSAFQHQPGELMNGEIRALPGAVHCKETQGNEAYAIQVAVHMSHQLTADLSAGVRANWQQDMIVFSPWHVRVDAVHARR